MTYFITYFKLDGQNTGRIIGFGNTIKESRHFAQSYIDKHNYVYKDSLEWDGIKEKNIFTVPCSENLFGEYKTSWVYNILFVVINGIAYSKKEIEYKQRRDEREHNMLEAKNGSLTHFDSLLDINDKLSVIFFLVSNKEVLSDA